ncbi:unnamed protein product [Rotaria sp. Silwood1]|nr:unnamed protein product [Rotaria sp. Silwood1]
MFRAAIILSERYNITFQEEFIGYEEILTDDKIMLTVDQTCEKVSTSNIVGFVGPAYSSEARYMASFAYQLGIISVSYSATSPDLSTINNGAFFRVVPSDENTVLGMTILFQQYKWKSCIIIYQNDEYGYNGMQSLKQKFNEMNIKTREIIRFDMNSRNFQIDFTETLLNSSSRIVILWANEQSTITILNRALEENLVGPDFVWILTTTISLNNFNQRQKKELIGVLTLEPVKGDFVDQSINTTLLNQAYEIWKYYEPDTFPGDSNVSTYALYTFDATWSLILSLQQLCSMQLSCLQYLNVSNCYYRQFFNRNQYYENMRTISFLGVSGEVKFSNRTADRAGHTYYIIKNIQPLDKKLNSIGYLPVLEWDTSSSIWKSYKNQSDGIIWPNWSKNIPVGHKLIRGQELRMAIIEASPFIILKNSTALYSGMTDKYKIINMIEFDGFFKDVLLHLQDKMGFIPVIMLAQVTTQYNELVAGVANNLFDTVMTTITMTEERKSLVDFSIPLIPSTIRVVTRKPESNNFDFLFFAKPFSWQLWLLILGTITYASILIWYFEWSKGGRTAAVVNNNHGERVAVVNNNDGEAAAIVNNNGIEWTIMYVLDVMLNRVPNFAAGGPGILLTYGLYILQIILFALYTASLLSSIITQNSDFTISGVDDIKNGKIAPSRVGLVAGSSIEAHYLNTISNGKKDYYPLRTVNEIYTSLIKGDIDAALWSNLSIAYHTNNVYCDLMPVGIDFSYSSYILPVKHDWEYKADLDSNILSLIGSAELDRISTKWFVQRTCIETGAFDKETKPITLQAVIGLTKKINLQQSSDTLSSSTSMTLKPSPPIQQPASLAPVSVSTGTSSSMTIPSANTQTPASQTNSRKRGHSSSQVASSQKTKRNRS